MSDVKPADISLAADTIIESFVEACAQYDKEILEAIANNPNYRSGWPGLAIREYLAVWRGTGERP